MRLVKGPKAVPLHQRQAKRCFACGEHIGDDGAFYGKIAACPDHEARLFRMLTDEDAQATKELLESDVCVRLGIQ